MSTEKKREIGYYWVRDKFEGWVIRHYHSICYSFSGEELWGWNPTSSDRNCIPDGIFEEIDERRIERNG